MSKPWLNIIGIGEDGMAGLSPAAKTLVENAQIIIGGDRHHGLAGNVGAVRVSWPSPFDAMIDKIREYKGKRVVILVTGDPLWYSVGARIGRAIDPTEICYHPQISAFQLVACHMGWSLADVETLTIHGRPAEQIIPWITPDAKLLVLTKDETSPAAVAKILTEMGYGNSKLTVLAAIGGEDEARIDGHAKSWDHQVPPFHTLAISCVADANVGALPKTGLPDNLFVHDGNITKQAIRAITLAKLVPQHGALLWDIGSGCGSISVEWMRGAREARAIGIEPKAARRNYAAQNALALGTPALQQIDGKAPAALNDLAPPDAIFIGGGASDEVLDICMSALKPRGRLVANAVTLEREGLLFEFFRKFGGDLQRLNIQRAEAFGTFYGWKNAMPITQWHFDKPGGSS